MLWWCCQSTPVSQVTACHTPPLFSLMWISLTHSLLYHVEDINSVAVFYNNRIIEEKLKEKFSSNILHIT